MKPCPCCGFVPTPTNQQILNLYKKEFGDAWATTIMEMFERQWITTEDRADLDQLKRDLSRFFELDSVVDLKPFMDAANPQSI